MLHEMKLAEGPFERMRKGEKVIELRLYDEKRQGIKIGDVIKFSKLPNLTETLSVEVTGLLVYRTFPELIEDLPASYLGYKESDKDYLKSSMYEIYSREDEEKYGVLGIRLKFIN